MNLPPHTMPGERAGLIPRKPPLTQHYATSKSRAVPFNSNLTPGITRRETTTKPFKFSMTSDVFPVGCMPLLDCATFRSTSAARAATRNHSTCDSPAGGETIMMHSPERTRGAGTTQLALSVTSTDLSQDMSRTIQPAI